MTAQEWLLLVPIALMTGLAIDAFGRVTTGHLDTIEPAVAWAFAAVIYAIAVFA